MPSGQAITFTNTIFSSLTPTDSNDLIAEGFSYIFCTFKKPKSDKIKDLHIDLKGFYGTTVFVVCVKCPEFSTPSRFELNWINFKIDVDVLNPL